jgi:WD40 repeat protein
MAIDVVKIREFIGHTQAVYAMCLNPNGNGLYSAGADTMLVEWNLKQSDGLMRAKMDAATYALCHNGQWLLAGSQKGNLSVFDLQFNLFKFLKVSEFPIFDILFDQERFLVCSGDGFLRVFNLDFELIKTLRISNKSIRQIIVNNTGFALACSDGKITILDTNLEIDDVFQAHDGTVFSLAFDPNTGKLISGSKDACIHFYDSLAQKERVKAHLLHVHTLAVNKDTSRLLSGSMDKEIKLWDIKENKLLKVVNLSMQEAHRSSVNKILWFDKNNFISCSDDRTLMCFEIQDQK